MKPPSVPYGHPSTLRISRHPGGVHPCKGVASSHLNYLPLDKRFVGNALPQRLSMSVRQLAWMQANKPLYVECSLTEALPHLPPELRFV